MTSFPVGGTGGTSGTVGGTVPRSQVVGQDCVCNTHPIPSPDMATPVLTESEKSCPTKFREQCLADRTTYSLTLRAEGNDPRPAIIRLRSLLKLMLRGFGLRVITIRELPADRSAQQAGPAA